MIGAARVLLIDDQASLLDILERWLSSSGYEVQVAPDGLTGLSLTRDRRFEVVITDLKMPGFTGLQLLRIFKGLDPLTQIIFLSGQGTMQDAIEALREGQAFDFLQKPLGDLYQLNLAIEKALMRRRSLAESEQSPAILPALPPWLEALTNRDIELMRLLSAGHDNREMAERLSLSEKTVRNNLTRLYEKIGVANRTQALFRFNQFRLI